MALFDVTAGCSTVAALSASSGPAGAVAPVHMAAMLFASAAPAAVGACAAFSGDVGAAVFASECFARSVGACAAFADAVPAVTDAAGSAVIPAIGPCLSGVLREGKGLTGNGAEAPPLSSLCAPSPCNCEMRVRKGQLNAKSGNSYEG